jgi:hypothetical protein
MKISISQISGLKARNRPPKREASGTVSCSELGPVKNHADHSYGNKDTREHTPEHQCIFGLDAHESEYDLDHTEDRPHRDRNSPHILGDDHIFELWHECDGVEDRNQTRYTVEVPVLQGPSQPAIESIDEPFAHGSPPVKFDV